VRDHHALPGELVSAVRGDLQAIDRQIRPGTLHGVGSRIESLAEPRVKKIREQPRATIERIQADLAQFVKKNSLDDVIVVNLASTEPPVS
jgi:myo-inositol-1-phosphate synthase